MDFLFVDRIVDVEPSRRIDTLKNVAGLDDVFADHVPGHPVLPGALVVEAFAQASQLLIAASPDFTQVGRLRRLSRAAFRQRVRPGEQLAIRCERRAGDEHAWMLDATATVRSRWVAAATLEYALEPAEPGTHADRQAERLRTLARELRQSPVEIATRGRDE